MHWKRRIGSLKASVRTDKSQTWILDTMDHQMVSIIMLQVQVQNKPQCTRHKQGDDLTTQQDLQFSFFSPQSTQGANLLVSIVYNSCGCSFLEIRLCAHAWSGLCVWRSFCGCCQPALKTFFWSFLSAVPGLVLALLGFYEGHLLTRKKERKCISKGAPIHHSSRPPPPIYPGKDNPKDKLMTLRCR